MNHVIPSQQQEDLLPGAPPKCIRAAYIVIFACTCFNWSLYLQKTRSRQDLSGARFTPAAGQASSSDTVSVNEEGSYIWQTTCWQSQTTLDNIHGTHSRFSQSLRFLDDMLTPRSASHFAGAHHIVTNGGTFNSILGNYVVVAEPG